MDELTLWIWLSLAATAYTDLDKLLEHFSYSVEDVYKCDSDDLGDLKLKPTTSEAIDDKNLAEAEKIRTWCDKNGIGMISITDPLYPKNLFDTERRPCLLYCKGKLIDLSDRFCLAVVGTRRMTEYGQRCAYTIAYDFTKAGGVIVSGMADGIDGTAHRGCLDAGGYTIAVLGCGIDRAYPSSHRELMKEIAAHGCVISQFRPGMAPLRNNFLIRNRVISGLCQATLVAEAPLKSGALNTASHAQSQGRKVFALPGKIGELTSAGTNELLRSGAEIVTCAKDIILEYYPFKTLDWNKIPTQKLKFPTLYDVKASPVSDETVLPEPKPDVNVPDNVENRQDKTVSLDMSGLDENEKTVYLCFESTRRLTPDEISERISMPVGEVSSCLTMLEIYGKIERNPGGIYEITGK